jgi:hypothetical protein
MRVSSRVQKRASLVKGCNMGGFLFWVKVESKAVRFEGFAVKAYGFGLRVMGDYFV